MTDPALAGQSAVRANPWRAAPTAAERIDPRLAIGRTRGAV